MPIDSRLADLKASVEEPLPHPDLPELHNAAKMIEQWALHHHQTLADQSIGLTASPATLQPWLDQAPPEDARPFAEVFRQFDEQIAPYAFRVNHPRFLAFVPGAPSVPSMLGDWLTAAANFFAGVWLEASGPAQVEGTVLDWFRQWLGMPETTRGVLTTGGSEANLLALVVARERLPYADRARAVLYVAEQRHWSIDRAAKVMGLHPEQIHALPVDEDFRLRARQLSNALEKDRRLGKCPFGVVANAGATNTGTVDDLGSIAAFCRAEGLWLHVDAAYGWAAALSQRRRQELAGIAEADSITLDPHKWLAQTFDVGCLLLRDGRLLPDTFAMRPDYLQDVTPGDGEVNYADRGIALTRRFRALKIWLSMQMLGLGWFRHLVEHCCRLAEYAQAMLESSGFEILCPRRLSIVCFRYVADGHDLDELNSRLLAALRETGRAFLSSTRLRGAFAIRVCFVNWRTTAIDVDEIISLLAKLGREIANGKVVPNLAAMNRPGPMGNAPLT